MVQGLGLQALTDQETKIPEVTQCHQKKKKKEYLGESSNVKGRLKQTEEKREHFEETKAMQEGKKYY